MTLSYAVSTRVRLNLLPVAAQHKRVELFIIIEAHLQGTFHRVISTNSLFPPTSMMGAYFIRQ